MITLEAPAHYAEPGYPVRADLLADQVAVRRVASALAASTLTLLLGGCGPMPSRPEKAPATPMTPESSPSAAPTAVDSYTSCMLSALLMGGRGFVAGMVPTTCRLPPTTVVAPAQPGAEPDSASASKTQRKSAAETAAR